MADEHRFDTQFDFAVKDPLLNGRWRISGPTVYGNCQSDYSGR